MRGAGGTGNETGMEYLRPLAMTDAARPAGAFVLAGGWCWFDRVEVLQRGAAPRIFAARDLPDTLRAPLTAPRAMVFGLLAERPAIMGILNVTPDSFSDGGQFLATGAALQQAQDMAGSADLIDIGGESTRPGAAAVDMDEEIARTIPVITALRAAGVTVPLSIDTRKAAVAQAALQAGCDVVNDVSALGHDPAMAGVIAQTGAPVILMHAQGDPANMQSDPRYDDVLLDVYDALAARILQAEAAGIARDRIVVDPGIGFGKTVAHNLALIRGLSLFHGLGCPVLIGASRKRFIGTLSGGAGVEGRLPGSLAVALAAAAQGVQIIRVHDVAETRQALTLWQAITTGEVA